MAVTSNTYTVGGSGQAGPYSYSFPIIASTDIRVTVNGALKTVTTHYTVDTGNTRITFVSGQEPSTGDKVIVYRDTDEDPINATFVSGSTIRSNELNDNFKQLLYISQESDNQSMSTLGGTMQADFGLGKDADIVFEGSTDNAHEITLTVADPTADRTITLPNTTGTVVTTGDTGTVTSTMITDGTIVNGDIANTTITGGKLVNDTITATQIAANAVTASELADDAVDTDAVADDAVTYAKIQNVSATDRVLGRDSSGAGIIEEITPANLRTMINVEDGATADQTNAEIRAAVEAATDSNVFTDADHTKLNGIETAATADQTATEIKALLASDNLDASHLAANSVGTSEIADAELVTLAGMPSATASILASSTALTSTTAELNLLDGKSVVTSVSGSSTDVQLPTAKAVNDQIVATLQDVGGFYPIDDELKFPNTNPDPNDDAGTIVSIADAGGIVVNGSGVSTTGRTLGGATVTINGIDSTLNNTTIAAGKGMLVQTTSTLNTYTYHRLVVDEAGVASAQTLVTDFNQRYQVASSAPSNQPDGTALAEGDLFFNTGTNKMMVYDGSAYAEVTSVGDYKLLTVVPDGATSGSPDYTNLSFDLRDGSNAANVTSVGQLLVSVNGVLQKPNATSWSASNEGFHLEGTNGIKFCTAPGSGASVYVTQIGSATTVQVPADNSVSTVKLQNASVTAEKLATMDDHVEWADNKYAKFGDSGDLCVYHNVNSFIKDNGAGSLILDTNGLGVKFTKSGLSETMAYFITDGACELYYDNAKKLATTSTGVHITGNVNLEGELGLFNGSTDAHRYIDCGLGDDNSLTIRGCEGGDTAHETLAKFTRNGACELYHDATKKLETESTGVAISGTLSFGDGTGAGGTNKIAFGASDDLNIFHNGSNSYIDDTGTGDLFIRGSNDLYITNTDGSETKARFATDGAVYLYYDNTSEFETKSGGVKLNGHSEQIVTALTSASTVTIDFSLSNHFSCTMGHNITFANPSTESIGQSGTITLTQDGTGSRTAAWGTQFLWAGGTAPTLTTTANAIDRIDYVVVAADKIHCVATLALD